MTGAAALAPRPTGRPAYHRAADLADAIAALAGTPGARPLAGGTDLMNQVRLGIRRPPLVVDLADVAELAPGPGTAGDGTAPRRLAARTTVRQVLADTDLGLPALRDAADLLGGRQIQAVATIGGNLCTASPAAETATPLLVADATAVVAGPEGERRVALRDLWTGPGRTCLADAEVLVAVEHDPDGGAAASAYRRIELRRSVDIALVGLAVRLVVTDGRIADARIAASAVAPTPLVLDEAARHLLDAPVDADPAAPAAPALEQAVARAAEAAQAGARPIDDVRASGAYRRAMVGVLVRRTVAAALAAGRREGAER